MLRFTRSGLAALPLALVAACGGVEQSSDDDPVDPDADVSGPPDAGENDAGALSGPASVAGVIGAMGGGNVTGTIITLDGRPVDANEQGWFFINQVEPAERALLEVHAPGFVATQRVVTIVQGRQTFVDVQMKTKAAPVLVDAAAGGMVVSTTGAGTLMLPGGAVRTMRGQTYSGMANVSLTPLDPTTRAERLAAPGDFTGVLTSALAGDVVRFESFGMMDVAIEDMSGNPLTVDPAASAILEIPVPSGMTGTPPETLPLWRYDAAIGRWVEAAAATYNAPSNCYAGPVTQTAYWNADRVYATACVTGQVLTPEGQPAIGGISVVSEGLSYIGEAWAVTDENGRFRVEVMASTPERSASAQIYAQSGGLYADINLLVAVTPMDLASTEKCLEVGAIELAYPLARMILTWGAAPNDLDSHMTGPDGAKGRFHVYYGASNLPQAILNTDDTSSFGPEVVSLLRATPGTYVYAVHNFSGDASTPIVESGARVQALFPSESLTIDISGATGQASSGSSVWRVFTFDIDGNGNIGRIEPIQAITDAGETAYHP